MKHNLNLYPYKLEIKQSLTDKDKAQCFQMCMWFNEMIENDKHWVGKVWFSYEAHFHLDGSVNSQTCQIWAQNLQILLPPNHSTAKSAHQAVHKFKRNHRILLVWRQRWKCGVSKLGKLSLCNYEVYCLSSSLFWLERSYGFNKMVCVVPDTAAETRKLLFEKFENLIIFLKNFHVWAPQFLTLAH